MPNSLDLKEIYEGLDRLVTVVSRLEEEGTLLTSNVKNSLNVLIYQLDKVYGQVVDILSPFYEITYDATLRDSFNDDLDKFKKRFFDDKGEVDRTKVKDFKASCTEVQDQLYYLSNVADLPNPWVKNELRKMHEAADMWYQDDRRAYDTLFEFLKQVDNGMSNVKSQVDLQMFLQGSEVYFQKIKDLYSHDIQDMKKLSKG